MPPWQVPGDTWREKLATWLAGADEPSESDTEYDGALSYASEWHSAIIGLGAGLGLGAAGVAVVVATALGLKRWQQISTRKAIRDLRREPWYGIGAALVGYFGHHRAGLPSVMEVLPSLAF